MIGSAAHRGGPAAALALLLSVAIQASCEDSTAARGDSLVAQLRELPTPLPTCINDCVPPPSEVLRHRLYTELGTLKADGVKALARGYRDEDVRMRRNVALALGWLGGGYDSTLPKLDVEPALRELTSALTDSDFSVRAWSAQALGTLKERAAPSVPALIVMLGRDGEGDQLNACFALRDIGSPARDALPALRPRLASPHENVRRCAGDAIQNF